MHISSSYAKILGEKLFRTWEVPRSGSKAEDGGKRGEKERLNNGDNNGQATHGARKPPGPKRTRKYVLTMANYVCNAMSFGPSGLHASVNTAPKMTLFIQTTCIAFQPLPGYPRS